MECLLASSSLLFVNWSQEIVRAKKRKGGVRGGPAEKWKMGRVLTGGKKAGMTFELADFDRTFLN